MVSLPKRLNLTTSDLDRHAPHTLAPTMLSHDFISKKVFCKLFFKIQPPHNSVNLSFISNNVKSKLTNLTNL